MICGLFLEYGLKKDINLVNKIAGHLVRRPAIGKEQVPGLFRPVEYQLIVIVVVKDQFVGFQIVEINIGQRIDE